MQEEALLQAIYESPDDTTLRLVYADWLDDHDQPERAEFIRAECEMDAIHDDPTVGPNEWDNPRFWELNRRAGQLYDRHASKWFGPLFRTFRGEVSTRRGFPSHVALSVRKFIEKGETLFQAAPTIEDVFLDRLGQNMPALAQCPALDHVRQLTFFETPFRQAEAEQFAASAYLGKLRQLHIGFTDTQIGPAGAVAFANAATMRSLEDLDIHNHAIYDGAASILHSPGMVKLTNLRLGNNGLTDDFALSLRQAESLRLVSLDLMWNYLTSEGVRHIAEAPHLVELKELTLLGNSIGYDGALSLVRGASFAEKIQRLHLMNCDLDDAGVVMVLNGQFSSLAHLNLAGNEFGSQSARAFLATQSLNRFQKLSLGACGITPEAARLLGRGTLPTLKTLECYRNPLGPNGIQALLRGPLVSTVGDLDLEITELGDAGTEIISRSPTLAKVRWLKLRGNNIEDRGAICLADSPHLEGVQSLCLGDNPIRKKGKAALKRRFGDRVEF